MRARIVLAFFAGFLTALLILILAAPVRASTDEVVRYRAYLACKAASNGVVTYKCLDLNPFYNG